MSAAGQHQPQSEALAGLVERVPFHNPDSGFCVLRLKARGQRDLVTVVGHAAMIAPGEFVQMTGAWTNDRTHGLQFHASFLKASPPTTLDGIERYLGSGMIRGIGPACAKRLVRAFAEAVFNHALSHLVEHGLGMRELASRRSGLRSATPTPYLTA